MFYLIRLLLLASLRTQELRGGDGREMRRPLSIAGLPLEAPSPFDGALPETGL